MDKSCEENPRQVKELRNSQKLEKVIVTYKTNKLVPSRKYMSLKTRSSEKAPYQKIVVETYFL